MTRFERNLQKLAAVITLLSFILAIDINAAGGLAPSKIPESSIGFRLTIFLVIDFMFAYYFSSILVLIAEKTGSDFQVSASFPLGLLIICVSTWQTVSLLFWFFEPFNMWDKTAYGVAPFLLNAMIFTAHVYGSTVLKFAYEFLCSVLAISFGFFCFQVAVW